MDEVTKARLKEIDKEMVEALEKQTELNAKVLKLIHEYINLNKSENNVDKPVMNIHTRGGGK